MKPLAQMTPQQLAEASPRALWNDDSASQRLGMVMDHLAPDEATLPMVRYRTRDLTRLLRRTARSMRRIEKITGRSDDMIILRGVNVFPTQIEEQILKCQGLAPHFQIELARSGRMDNMTVHVECAPDMSDDPARAKSAKELAHHIKSVVGVSTKIEVKDPNSITRSDGKAKRVIDNRPKE